MDELFGQGRRMGGVEKNRMLAAVAVRKRFFIYAFHKENGFKEKMFSPSALANLFEYTYIVT